MSEDLIMLTRTNHLTEPDSFGQFTYQHLTIANRKSKIDFFFLSQNLAVKWKGITRYCAFLDHQAIILFPVKDRDIGPGYWHLSNDLLGNTRYSNELQKMIQKWSQNDSLTALDNWTILKSECKMII